MNLRHLCPFALLLALIAPLAACTAASGSRTASLPPPELPADQAPTYADLVAMAERGRLVGVVEVVRQRVVPAENAPGLPPGMVRLALETRLQRLLAAPGVMGESLRFVVDRQPDARGRAPDLRRRPFLVVGNVVPGRPGELQLLASETMLPAGPEIEARMRTVLTQLAAPDSPPAVTGLRDVIWVPGNLAGESETQMLVETASGAPISLSVLRRPGMAPSWGVSLGEIVDQAARPPAPETLAWYRLACGLPPELPPEAFLQGDREARAAARADYAHVRQSLGPCERRFPL